MSKLPKLKIVRALGYPSEEIRDFEQAKYFLFSYGPGITVAVEGEVVQSYEELLKLAAQDCYKDKELLTVDVFGIVAGG